MNFTLTHSLQQLKMYGGECIAVIGNITLPINGTIYAASIIRVVNSEEYADVVLVQNSSALYTLGMYYDSQLRDSGHGIWKYISDSTVSWSQLSLVQNSLSYSVDYSIVVAYTFNTDYLALFNGTLTPAVVASDNTIIPAQISLRVYGVENSNRTTAAKRIVAKFDNFVVTVNVPSY